MKSLKIKKFLKIFSVIICSAFIFSNNVDASEIELNYSDLSLSAGLKEEMNEIIDYLKTIETNNYVVLTYSYYYNNFRLDVVKKQDDLSLVHANLYIDDPGNPFMLQWRFNKHAYYIHFNFSDYNLNYLKDMIANDSYTLSNYNSGYYFNTRTNRNINQLDVLIYSNIEFTVDIENDYEDNFYLNGNEIFNGDVLEQYYEYINNLEGPLKYRMQFNNDVSPDLKQITFDFPITAFNNNNTVSARIEFGNWNNIIEEIPIFNFLKIYGYDINENEIELSHWIGYGYDTTDYLTSKQIDFRFSLTNQPNDTIPNNILRVKVYFDFETFNNNYYFNVFDNFIEGTTTWNYIENFLVDYKKYEFKENYDIAIIRSKNFQDLDSFYISDKIYFTSDEYEFNLKLYDFNNKRETYNFTSLTQYLINPVYLKIPLKIDETNDIFPVLTKPIHNESGTCYLKEDLFVQFINSNNLDSTVEGITEEDFNNNNDLVIGGDIENLIPPQQSEQSLTLFFNQFWKMFEKFGDILSYITACFAEFFYTLPITIQFFLCISFAFVIYKMLIFFIL